MYIGATDRITLNTLISSTGLQLQNIHYAYTGEFKINDGISWKSYSSSIILAKVDFACAICDGFNQYIQSIADEFEIDRVYDVTNYCFYVKLSGGNWSQVTSADYDFYQKTILGVLFNVSRQSSGSSLNGSLQVQSEVNDELYSKLNNHVHTTWENYETIGGLTLDYNPALRMANLYGYISIKVTTSDLLLYSIPPGYRPLANIHTLAHSNIQYPTILNVNHSTGDVNVRSTNSSVRTVDVNLMWRY